MLLSSNLCSLHVLNGKDHVALYLAFVLVSWKPMKVGDAVFLSSPTKQ